MGGALAGDPERRRRVAAGGYIGTAVLAALIGLTGAVWQAALLRIAAWTTRGLRVPPRNALLADLTELATYGGAYGFERAMDNLGAIAGPLLALLLVVLVGARGAMLLSVVPGLLAAGAILYAIRQIPRPKTRERQPHARGFSNIAAVAGALLYRRGRDQTSALAMLQAYVPNQGDGWSHALDMLATGDRGAIERYQPFAALLRQRTGELHVALSSYAKDPAFAPEATTMLTTRSIYQSIRTPALQVMRQLKRQLTRLPEDAREEAEAVMALESKLTLRLRDLLNRPVSAQRIRCHGDYHLGQVLFTGGDSVIVDFEGEPLRPLPERRLKRWASKDVAGMLRSFTYAAEAARVEFGEDWAERASTAFLRAYWEAAGSAPFASPRAEERKLLLDIMLIEKAMYELRYELDNRPGWVRIPLRGLRRLLE